MGKEAIIAPQPVLSPAIPAPTTLALGLRGMASTRLLHHPAVLSPARGPAAQVVPPDASGPVLRTHTHPKTPSASVKRCDASRAAAAALHSQPPRTRCGHRGSQHEEKEQRRGSGASVVWASHRRGCEEAIPSVAELDVFDFVPVPSQLVQLDELRDTERKGKAMRRRLRQGWQRAAWALRRRRRIRGFLWGSDGGARTSSFRGIPPSTTCCVTLKRLRQGRKRWRSKRPSAPISQPETLARRMDRRGPQGGGAAPDARGKILAAEGEHRARCVPRAAEHLARLQEERAQPARSGHSSLRTHSARLSTRK